jgi:hypothetical protein
MAKGWHNDYERHAMARMGIKTVVKSPSAKTLFARVKEESKTAKEYAKEGFVSQAKDEERHAKFFKIFSKLDDAVKEMEEGDNKIAVEKLNEAKREIRETGKLDFMEMDGRTMAYSILSDAQESIPFSKKNAELFINQAKDLLKGNFKKEGHEITFPDGEVAIF